MFGAILGKVRPVLTDILLCKGIPLINRCNDLGREDRHAEYVGGLDMGCSDGVTARLWLNGLFFL